MMATKYEIEIRRQADVASYRGLLICIVTGILVCYTTQLVTVVRFPCEFVLRCTYLFVPVCFISAVEALRFCLFCDNGLISGISGICQGENLVVVIIIILGPSYRLLKKNK